MTDTQNPLVMVGQQYKEVANQVAKMELDLAELIRKRDELKEQLLQVAKDY